MLKNYGVIGVCGAGAMGAGIAQVAAAAGARVIIFDPSGSAIDRGRKMIADGLCGLVKRGKIPDADAETISSRCEWTNEIESLIKADFYIEAIIEDLKAKQTLFQEIEKFAKETTPIATNTSSLSVTELAASLEYPARFFGLHFFNPAPVMKLVEVVAGVETDPAYISGALDLMTSWGKTAVNARDVPGFIVNRVARPFYGEGWRAFEEGAANAATLDFLYRDLAGFRMGPFELGDLIGHDINTAAARSVFEAYFGRTRFTPSLAQGALVASGRLGRKTGRGVYSYSDENRPAPAIIAPADGESDPDLLNQVLLLGPIEIGGATVMMCDGRTASHIADESAVSVAVIDYVRDSAAASVVAFAASDDAADAAALEFASRCGKQAVRLKDRPGLVVFRTLLQLANCAADAVRDQVAAPDAIDLAMMNGVNYPFGPIEWARGFGFANASTALEAITAETGDAMYSPSEWLRAAARRGL